MYSLIIVEDEELSANALKKILDWESYGFTLTKVFTSSPDALDYLKREHTDAVLTDISMPEVTLQAFEQFVDSYVISLTGLLKECLYIESVPGNKIVTDDISQIKEHIKLKENNREQLNTKYKIGALEKAKEYIDKNYSENIGLNSIATIVGFESSYFSKIFKQHFGVSFSNYLSRVRINNVVSRVKLLFGDSGGFKIESNDDITSITIYHPVVKINNSR